MSGPVNGRRLIEDFLPITAINELAQREKIGHAATHPRKLHLWGARRPLAAARAAVYAALVPAEGRGDPERERRRFRALCKWDAEPLSIERARKEILEANGGVPPKVLDMFAGGGAIPLEAARLGCDATAIELNPVAHLIERCMLEFPQRFPGLADDVRRWGKLWVDRAWEQLADLYPPVGPGSGQQDMLNPAEERRPLAYLWTRTVICPNTGLPEHRAPLVRQTWLARKKGRCIALCPVVDRAAFAVRWQVVESTSEEGLGFNPADLSRRGHTTCLVCGAPISSDYVKAEGVAGRLGTAPLAAVVLKSSGRGRDYLPAGSYPLPDDAECERRLKILGLTPPDEQLPVGDSKNFWTRDYGITRYGDLFNPRQLLTLGTFAISLRKLHEEMSLSGLGSERALAVTTCLGLTLSRVADRDCTLAAWDPVNETAGHAFARQTLPVVWDFVESSPFGAAAGDISANIKTTVLIVRSLASVDRSSTVVRGSAAALPLERESQDAIITDPPYYDNISYADLSDFFYVWLKRSVGFLYPDDFGGDLAPKRNEAVVAPYRHHGDRRKAREFYERLMFESFQEAHRVLKPGAPLVCIYAHKTTLGWATLVDALRRAGFTITEAWPLDTEMPERSVGQGTASLASSLFLVGRKRDPDAGTGLEREVLAELDQVVAERLERLRHAGITGSDLVIAMVGAGLKPFTRYQRVERENGSELAAEQFLVIVQNRVLDALFGNLAGADPATRFYVASQFSYGYGYVPFDEANSLARMTGVELDGPRGLTVGKHALVEKKGNKVRLRDFEERGGDPRLGLPDDLGTAVPAVIDVAHGVLWRAEYRTSELRDYLFKTRPDDRLLHAVIQSLAGRPLRSESGNGKPRESGAAERLFSNWKYLIEDNLFG